MTDLLTELESAPPGKAIDRKIALSIGWHRVEPRYGKSKHGAWIAPEDFLGTYSSGAPILDGTHGTTLHRDVPDFTTSLDAALTLVPDGRWVGILIAALTRRWLPSGELEPPLTFERFILRVCREALKARQTDE